MGLCISSCVHCATYVHDQYTKWRWEEDTDFTFMDTTVFTKSTGHSNQSIHSAVIDKNIPEIRRLLTRDDINRNETNSAGETALHLACKLGYCEIIEELLDGGCSADVCTIIGTPMHCILKAIKTKYITEEQGLPFIYKLHNNGCNLDARDKGLKTALFCSAEQGSFCCIEALIILGADLNCVEVNKFSALYMSVIRGDLRCVNLLLTLRPGLDINQRDTAGRTPLISGLITITNNFRYERLPSDHYNSSENFSEDALAAHRHSRMAVIESLLRAGADTNVVDNHGRSALVLAFIILELDNIHHAVTSDKCVYCLHRGQNGVISCTYGIRQDSMDSSQELETCIPKNHMNPESIYTPLVRLLVLAGARFPDRWEKDYSKSPPWLQQLYEEAQEAWRLSVVKQPHKLVHLCRLSIRAHLANTSNLHRMEALPIPGKLQHYCMVKYL